MYALELLRQAFTTRCLPSNALRVGKKLTHDKKSHGIKRYQMQSEVGSGDFGCLLGRKSGQLLVAKSYWHVLSFQIYLASESL